MRASSGPSDRARHGGSWLLVCVTAFGACGFPRPPDLVVDADGAGSVDAARPIDGAVDANLLDAFVAPPAVTAFSPDWGSTAGGTRVRMLGFGFTGPHLVVKFGPAVASQVTVVSDTELTVTTPVGPHAPVDIAVTTDGGTSPGSKKYRYLAPLYAADARGTTPGNLYIVDPTNATSVTVGPLGVSVTGLALSPDGVMYGATAIKGGHNTLVTVDPYTARVTTIGPLEDSAKAGVGVTIPDLTFAGAQLLGWTGSAAGPSLVKIDPTTGRFTSFAAQAGASSSAAFAAVSDVTVLVVQNHNLSSVSTANGALVRGPMLVGDAGANGLTFVGGVIYASEPTSVTPKLSALVTINQTTGAITVVGPLPPSTDALVGIPSQSPSTSALSLADSAGEAAPGQVAAAPPYEAMLRVSRSVRPIRDILALGHDVVDGARVRRVTPLTELARLGLGGQVLLMSQDGAMRRVALNTPGLALAENHRHQLKLVDTRQGFHQIFGRISEIRSSGFR